MFRVTFKKDGKVKRYMFCSLTDIYNWLVKNMAIVKDGFVKIAFVEEENA